MTNCFVRVHKHDSEALLYPRMTSEGAKTIEQRSATSDAHADVTFFSSWFCPYAQRAWIALEEKGVAYKYVEINPYEIGADGDTKRALSLEQKRERYPEFVRCSPRGLVPALNHGKPVWESLVGRSIKGSGRTPIYHTCTRPFSVCVLCCVVLCVCRWRPSTLTRRSMVHL